jgi:hypothetical protein
MARTIRRGETRCFSDSTSCRHRPAKMGFVSSFVLPVLRLTLVRSVLLPRLSAAGPSRALLVPGGENKKQTFRVPLPFPMKGKKVWLEMGL